MKFVPVIAMAAALAMGFAPAAFAKSKKHPHHHHHVQTQRMMSPDGSYAHYPRYRSEQRDWGQTGFSPSFGNNSSGTRSPGVPGDLGNR